MSDASADRISVVQAGSTPVRGRFVLSAREAHWVSDARAASGGPGEAVNAGELLLAALASCALAVIQQEGERRGWTVGPVQVQALFERDDDDKTRYARIAVQAQLPALPLEQGRALVEQFAATCPIFNSLQRGSAEGAVTARLVGH